MKHPILLPVLAALPCAPVFAQSTQWSEHGYHFVGAVDLSVDVNGDGLADAIIGDQLAGTGSGGEVTVRSGVDGALLHSVVGPAGAHYGRRVVGISDLNGDGFDEFGYCGSLGGIQAVDGATGNPLHGYTAGGAETYLAGTGDVNGDGWTDVVVSNPGVLQGSVKTVSGRFLATNVQPIFLWTVLG